MIGNSPSRALTIRYPFHLGNGLGFPGAEVEALVGSLNMIGALRKDLRSPSLMDMVVSKAVCSARCGLGIRRHGASSVTTVCVFEVLDRHRFERRTRKSLNGNRLGHGAMDCEMTSTWDVDQLPVPNARTVNSMVGSI